MRPLSKPDKLCLKSWMSGSVGCMPGWTRCTTQAVASALQAHSITITDRTVCRILKALGYALGVNHKKLVGASHPDRSQQFDLIAELRTRALNMRLSLVSVDTKKKELTGCFRNAGTCWRRAPKLVNDHDFRSQADGRAVPYGLYDLRANTGAFYVGLSRRSSL